MTLDCQIEWTSQLLDFFQTGIANDTALAYFYFAPKVMKTTEHYFYTALSLLAEIGGYLGRNSTDMFFVSESVPSSRVTD